MGSLSETYVDPSIAGNSGAGTSGDPYGDLQYALDTMTRDGTNGDRINIKAGTDEILTAALDYTTYGTPSAAAPLVFQGYTTSAGDGGIGGIDGNGGAYGIHESTSIDHVSFIDMKLHNTNYNSPIIRFDNNCQLINCELYDHVGTGTAVHADAFANIIGCYFHDNDGTNINVFSNGFIYNCLVDTSHVNFGSNFVISNNSSKLIVMRCIFIHDNSSANVIHNITTDAIIAFNSIWANGSSGDAIRVSTSSAINVHIYNNAIEGFSATNGTAIDYNSVDRLCFSYNNTFYNNNTNERNSTDKVLALDNESVGSALFSDPSNAVFSDRFTKFAPNDVGSMQAGAYPSANNLDRGAAQTAGGGGSSGGTITKYLNIGGS